MEDYHIDNLNKTIFGSLSNKIIENQQKAPGKYNVLILMLRLRQNGRKQAFGLFV